VAQDGHVGPSLSSSSDGVPLREKGRRRRRVRRNDLLRVRPIGIPTPDDDERPRRGHGGPRPVAIVGRGCQPVHRRDAVLVVVAVAVAVDVVGAPPGGGGRRHAGRRPRRSPPESRGVDHGCFPRLLLPLLPALDAAADEEEAADEVERISEEVRYGRRLLETKAPRDPTVGFNRANAVARWL